MTKQLEVQMYQKQSYGRGNHFHFPGIRHAKSCGSDREKNVLPFVLSTHSISFSFADTGGVYKMGVHPGKVF